MNLQDYYVLPSSPTDRCIDRFSIVADIEEDEDGQIPFWTILVQLLSTDIASPHALIDALETIAVTTRGSSSVAGDYGTLRKVLDSRLGFFQTQWPRLAKLALSMPELFPSNTLPILGRSRAALSLQLSQRQVGCLVVHQFLGTLRSPSWKDDGLHDFGAWYGCEQRHEQAVMAYLDALFLYFENLSKMSDDFGDSKAGSAIRYAMHDTLSRAPDFLQSASNEEVPLSELNVCIVEKYSTDPAALGLPNGACVVSANRFIGFGQSATQEEIHVGCSPEACPAVLITPPLQDDQVLVVKGAEAMLNITGQRRDIAVESQQWPASWKGKWEDRTMLFMDALELDMVSSEAGLPDLQPGNVDREIRKGTIAFSSGEYDETLVGLWGCGAFCGDPGVKMTALWCAASLAGVKLSLIFETTQRSFAEEYKTFAMDVRKSFTTTNRLRQMLDLAPKTLERHHTLKWFTEFLLPNNV